ncbi:MULTISPECIES: AdeC/AdeK/OprM family multidrug efflux complex outer membrane factor [unclassified Acinetobacter]|uniref:AdeC/AdeK/OprM family multidrug efflux complex outer membrane factor n=1 Tax=unclassified Acinetobacter TaxID=196816 RepID=UPI0035B9F415
MLMSVLAVALAACQSTRIASEPQPIVKTDIPQTFTALPQPEQPSIAAQGYQEFFADQRLKDLIALALQNNRDLRVAALNVEKVQQQYRIAYNGLLPTVGANAGITQSGNSSQSNTSYNVNLGVTNYELDFWGRVASLKDAALDNYFATRAAQDSTQVALIGQIAMAWVNLSYAEQNLALAEQTLKTQQQALDLNQKRFNAGITSELPVSQARVSVETARGDVANNKTQIQQAKNALNLLAGQVVPNNLLPTRAVQSITNNTVLNAGLPSELLNNRPDLQGSEYRLRAAGANITAARARLFPSISLTGSAGLASTSLSDLFSSGAFVWRLAPSVDLPIFDWGTRQANVKVNETEQKIALANYEKAIQTAFREVNDVLATRANIGDRIAAQQRLVAATNSAYRIADARFKAGLDNYLSVLSAQQNNYNVEKGLLALQQAQINSQIELYKTLGGGATLMKSPTNPTPVSTTPKSP